MPTMRMPWSKSGNLQLDLLDAPTVPEAAPSPPAAPGAAARSASMAPTASLHEDANNPRTEIPEAELDELADDIRQHGILQPIVVPGGDGDSGPFPCPGHSGLGSFTLGVNHARLTN